MYNELLDILALLGIYNILILFNFLFFLFIGGLYLLTKSRLLEKLNFVILAITVFFPLQFIVVIIYLVNAYRYRPFKGLSQKEQDEIRLKYLHAYLIANNSNINEMDYWIESLNFLERLLKRKHINL